MGVVGAHRWVETVLTRLRAMAGLDLRIEYLSASGSAEAVHPSSTDLVLDFRSEADAPSMGSGGPGIPVWRVGVWEPGLPYLLPGWSGSTPLGALPRVALGFPSLLVTAPVLRLVLGTYGLEAVFATILRPYPHGGHGLPRQLAGSLLPTASRLGEVLPCLWPELAGRVLATAVYVPGRSVSLAELHLVLAQEAGAREVRAGLRTDLARFAGDLVYSEEPLLSEDVAGQSVLAVLDGLSLGVAGRLLRLRLWYDEVETLALWLRRALERFRAESLGAAD